MLSITEEKNFFKKINFLQNEKNAAEIWRFCVLNGAEKGDIVLARDAQRS